jgi:hypothetical protein
MRAKPTTAAVLLICAVAAILLLRPKLEAPLSMRHESPVETGTAVTAPPPARDVPVPPAPEPEIAAHPEPEVPVMPDPQADPKTAVAEALRLFREGDMGTLFLKFMPPEAVARMTEEQKVGAVAELQAAKVPGTPMYERMQMLMPVLESLSNTEPSYDETGNFAMYEIKAVTSDGFASRGGKLKMKRVDGRWYLD